MLHKCKIRFNIVKIKKVQIVIELVINNDHMFTTNLDPKQGPDKNKSEIKKLLSK